ncbi:type II secretion system protein GspH [Tamilnaduibacter salinus]|nr:type II secretion system protein GspH [Tamilnaduibacter salinus]
MVVLVVVGLLAVIAVVNLGSGGQRQALENDIRELFLLMQTASEEAVFNNQELGVRVTDEGYRFLALDPLEESWEPLGERLFEPRQWSEGVVVTLDVDTSLPGLASGEDDGGEEEALQPDIVFFSSGESTAFELVFSPRGRDEVRHRLETDGLEPIEWLRPGESDDWEEE